MRNAIHVDLVRLAAKLSEAGRHPEFVKAVDRAAAVGSIRDDLRGALMSLELIGRIQERAKGLPGPLRPDDEETTITGALFTQAIILYARAAVSTGDRPSLLGDAELTSAERATHREVKKLRNGAFAHFGRAEDSPDGPLVKEAVILSFTKTQKRVGVYTTRAQFKVGVTKRLTELLHVRLDQVAERQQALFDAASDALDNAVSGDPALRVMLPEARFDPDAFCASPEAAALVRAQLAADSMDDMVYAVPVPNP